MKPLEGVKIFDLTHMMSGPTCTVSLALLGAEVTKIERPGDGDWLRHHTGHAGASGVSIPFAAVNMSKKSLAMDLRHPQAQAVIRRLAETSDIVVENFRPGVAAAMGVDWPSLQAINPRLVYCSVSGFGHAGPLRDWSGFDQVIQAMSGALWTSGEPTDGPVRIGFPVVDAFTGYMAAFGILAALRRRDLTGVGECIDVAMLDSMMKLMGTVVATTLYTGAMPVRSGNLGGIVMAAADMYPTADGYVTLGAMTQPQFVDFCAIMDCAWILDDPRCATVKARAAHVPVVRAMLEGVLKDAKALDVEARLNAGNVPACKVRDYAEIMSHPHFDHRAVMTQTTLPATGETVRVLGNGFEIDGDLTPGPVPALGEHTDAVLADLGFGADAIAEMRAQGVVA